MSDPLNPYASPAATTTAPGVEWMRTDSAALAKTATGLSLVYYGIVLLLLSLLLTVGAAFVPFAMFFTLGGIIIASIMMFVGPLFCLSVPAETNAKGLIIGAVAFQLINLAFAVMPAAGIEVSGLESVAQIFGLLSGICFVLFMRRLAQFIGREDLADRAGKVLGLGVAVFLTMIAAVGAMLVLGPTAGVLVLVAAIMGIVLFVMYANLINSLSKALKSGESNAANVAHADA